MEFSTWVPLLFYLVPDIITTGFTPPPLHTPSVLITKFLCFLESLQRSKGTGLRFKSVLREMIPVDLIDTEFVSH
jgi:hypothetical protein